MCPSLASTASTGKATRSWPARHRDRDGLRIIIVGCRSVSASPLRLDFSQRIARDSGASGPSNVTRSDSLRFDDGAVIGSCRSRCARGVWDRPSPYRRYFRGVSEALPRRRRCKASAPVLRASSTSRRECRAARRGRARLVQAASRRSVGTKSRRDGPRRAVARQEMKGCHRSKAGGYASRSAWRLPCRGL